MDKYVKRNDTRLTYGESYNIFFLPLFQISFSGSEISWCSLDKHGGITGVTAMLEISTPVNVHNNSSF